MLEVGCTHTMTWSVSQEHLASSFGSGLVDVLATPVLVGFCEECSRHMVDQHLSESQKTVGTAVSLTHTAATPLGMKVTLCATLTDIDGRKLTFAVTCRDEIESIGECTHTRFIIDAARFEKGIDEKASKMAQMRSGEKA